MAVSIILPTHNDGHFLKTSLPSCFTQNVEKEIIIVDDASTQPLPDEIQRLMEVHKFIRYIRHDSNRGLSAARNTGIAAAQYDLIIPLDTDDYFYHNTIEPMEKAMTDDVDVVYGNVADNGVNPPRGQPPLIHYPKPQPWTPQTFKEGNPLFCGSLFRKSIWEKVGGYTERSGTDKLLYEDYRFWAQCFKAGARFRYVDVNVYYHTSRSDGMLRIMHPRQDYYRDITLAGIFE